LVIDISFGARLDRRDAFEHHESHIWRSQAKARPKVDLQYILRCTNCGAKVRRVFKVRSMPRKHPRGASSVSDDSGAPLWIASQVRERLVDELVPALFVWRRRAQRDATNADQAAAPNGFQPKSKTETESMLFFDIHSRTDPGERAI
jgi:hypothetical protein